MSDRPLPPVLRGRDLRTAALVVLDRSPVPLPLAEVAGHVRRAGFLVGGLRPDQALADALAWEVGKGRAVRVGRGVYARGVVADRTMRRYRRRWATARPGP